MKINKQLFEDVLSGKLKGTFVLRFNGKVNSSNLMRNNYPNNDKYPYRLLIDGVRTNYTENGNMLHHNTMTDVDIVDFIPDTFAIDPEIYSYNEKDIQFIEHFINGYHMKENELTIEIPEGKIVDWEESKKQNKIVLKDKQLTYRDICIELFKHGHFYTDSNGIILESPHSIVGCGWSNNAPTRHQLECILAKNKLANVAKYLNDGWKPKPGDIVYGLMLEGQQNILFSQYTWNTDTYYLPQFTFKSQKLAQQAIEILGEETIKLALEPLGI